MGEIVLAAKMTHVPTMLMSEQEGPIQGKRQAAIDGHREIARRAKALGADTVVICDTHWVINAGFHINANTKFEGLLTSSEFPQFIQNMPYSHRGNPELGDEIAKIATEKGVYTLAHRLAGLQGSQYAGRGIRQTRRNGLILPRHKLRHRVLREVRPPQAA